LWIEEVMVNVSTSYRDNQGNSQLSAQAHGDPSATVSVNPMNKIRFESENLLTNQRYLPLGFQGDHLDI